MKERPKESRFQKFRSRKEVKIALRSTLAGIALFGSSCGFSAKDNNPDIPSPVPIKTGITDHSPDWFDTGSLLVLDKEYEIIKNLGFSEVRFDWRWRDIEPSSGQLNQDYEGRLKQAVEVLNGKGMESTIVLSTIPDWAMEIYKTDKEKFFKEWENYVGTVTNSLEELNGPKVERFQVLNELNHFFYSPVDVQDLPRLLEVTRNVLTDYNPNAKLMITLIAANLLDVTEKFGKGHDIMSYLDSLEKVQISKHIDILGIDYYPGSWHLPIENRWENKINIIKDVATVAGFSINPLVLKLEQEDILRDMFTDVNLLRKVFERVNTWGIDYELSETGFPSNSVWAMKTERMQEIYYKKFTPAFIDMLYELKAQGKELPDMLAIYQMKDERPRTKLEWLLAVIGDPLSNWGILNGDGEEKEVVESGTLEKELDLLKRAR